METIEENPASSTIEMESKIETVQAKVSGKKAKKKRQRQKKRQLAASWRDGEKKAEEESSEEEPPPKRIIGVWKDEWPNSNLQNVVSTNDTISGSVSEILEHAREHAALNPLQEIPIEAPPPKLNAREKAYQEAIDRTFNRPGQPIEEPKKEPSKQHSGLRCKKCFCLLVKDTDFEYKNGRLWIHPQVLKDKAWEGLIVKGQRVYCQNMHTVGSKEATTWTNETVEATVLKLDKTTFVENFVNNPKFAGSEIIKNKLRFAEPDRENMLIKLSIPTDPKFLPDQNAPTDRYHSYGSQTWTRK